MECKICNRCFNNKFGLNAHIKTHNISRLEYFLKYEYENLPNCICGKKVKFRGNYDFQATKTCGDINCIKKIQRDKRIEFMKNNPEQTAWRLSNLSYPEKLFKQKCEDLKLHEKHLIIRERPVFPYFIDFAFENEKVAVEIDGSQHNAPERKERDMKKESLLIYNEWRILRFTAKEIQTNIDNCFIKLLDFISSDILYEKVGMFENKKLNDLKKETLNKERQKNNGLTDKSIASSIAQRRVNRPSYNQLICEIKELGYSAVGRKFNVSDNTIRKWVKSYEKYGI